jgi:folate-binding protein YgfZ
MTQPFPPEESGTAFTTVYGTDVIRHHGEPAAEYDAAVDGVAIRDRGHRRQWVFSGRQPLQMLSGIVTGRMPSAPERDELGIGRGGATYHAVLTPKGRMISDLRLWLEAGAEEGDDPVVRADVPRGGAAALQEHLATYLPPRLARLEDRSGTLGMITLMGPQAARLLSGVVLGLRVEGSDLEALESGEFVQVAEAGGDQLTVIRSGQLSVPAWDILGSREALTAVWRMATEGGAIAVGLDTWNALRVEAGRPAWGWDLSEDVIPPEAGIQDLAIDYNKGCYTGQEVIIRIRDRGHVNRHLRRLVLDASAPLPPVGAELFAEAERPVGMLTTVVDSPRRGPLALGYVRRQVAPGDEVRVGSLDGPVARVEALEGTA